MEPDIQHLTVEQRIRYGELLRERIYSTITLLAVVVVMWQHPAEYSAWTVLGSIAGTVIALWLATLISSRMSFRIAHGEDELNSHYRKSAEAASGLLAPAATPLFFVLISAIGLLELKTALLLGVMSLVLSLFIFSLVSGRKVVSNRLSLLLFSALQMLLGLGVVALKLIIK